MEGTDLRVFEDASEVAAAAAAALDEWAAGAVEERGRFNLALAGGGTPLRLYRLLASEYRDRAWWSRTHVYWSDERYVPPGHADSNVAAARLALLDLVAVPTGQVHAPPTTFADPEEAAAEYGRTVAAAGSLDLVLLGLGEDGHIASLFPDGEALREARHRVVAVTDSPKPPPVRLTMTPVAFSQAKAAWLLVVGHTKRQALADSSRRGSSAPASWVRPQDGAVVWWVDRAASGGL